MPQFRKTSDQAKILGVLSDQAQQAKALDADPEKPGFEQENLVVVLFKGKEGESTHPRQRLSDEKVRKLSRVELLSVGYDRAYWRRGVSLKTHAELIEMFLAAQAGDLTLHGSGEMDAQRALSRDKPSEA